MSIVYDSAPAGRVGRYWGSWEAETATIWLHDGLDVDSPAFLATLAHETVHVASGHDGHQAPGIEARVNELVAVALVDRERYAFWEAEYGGHIGGIADGLDLPYWVIAAFRGFLARTYRPGCVVESTPHQLGSLNQFT
ncbi:hypothetical protein H8R18_01140 [Nanchangia anserum]|uniref:hypothetical protein n=1 Tax=Nanchangia anserum TaxID=2692125 RepID=UPI0018840F36|nr:hypothetical protein [Nanchangia anserum]QOX82009.1 hypothetical protein H8R18_01140 [Nanchangia anserum]